MVRVVLTEEQARVFSQAMEDPVQVCDPAGKVLAVIPPEMNKEFIAELKRRAASPGPFYSGQQVQARLQALQKEWDRTGGFDEKYMHEFMAKLDESDPPHMRAKRATA